MRSLRVSCVPWRKQDQTLAFDLALALNVQPRRDAALLDLVESVIDVPSEQARTILHTENDFSALRFGSCATKRY